MPYSDTVRMLVIEDDAEDYKLFTKAIAQHNGNFIISWADSLSAAQQQLASQTFDVILTDLSLPDSHGLETVSKLRQSCADAPIIVLTGNDDPDLEQDILDAGAQDYLVKGEIPSRPVVRSILHSVQRQRAINQNALLMTQLEEREEMLRKQTKLLRQKNAKLRQLYNTAQEFVDNVSHDFRTPLTVIKDYVSIVAEGMVGDVSHEQRAMLDKVALRAGDLNHMVDDLLDVSKLESGLLGAWRRSVSVHSVLQRSFSMLTQRAETKGVRLQMRCTDDLPAVYCDAEKVGRVVTNLAINAIKFVGEGGNVTISADVDPAGGQVTVDVADNGPGIDAETLSRLFGRFKQGHGPLMSMEKGFGLGLTIAQRFCELNLGELSVKSRVGQGSTFSFTVPLADPKEVIRRWLHGGGSRTEALELIGITTEASSEESAEAFDNFLNCLLRADDLLLQISTNQWLLVLSGGCEEGKAWAKRAEKEFRLHNRNRPLGPLPSYRYQVEFVNQGQGAAARSADSIDQIIARMDVAASTALPSIVS